MTKGRRTICDKEGGSQGKEIWNKIFFLAFSIFFKYN